VGLKSETVDSPKLPAEVIWQLAFSQDSSQLLFSGQGPATPEPFCLQSVAQIAVPPVTQPSPLPGP
jgi:hypothetical protein